MSAARVEIPCIKGKCCRPSTSTEFDSTHPAELSGIISPAEFQASIGRINASLKRPKWTFRVQTAGRILIVLGIVLLLFAGGKYFRMKHHHHHEEHNSNSNSNSIAPINPSPSSDTNEAVSQFDVNEPVSGSTATTAASAVAPVRDEEEREFDEREEASEGEKKSHHSKHGKCIKHLFHSGLISLIAGFALCRWISGRKIRQLITRVVPAICAEHHLYTSSSRAVPVSWSLEEKSICKYMCKNNGLKLVLDLHSLVPLSRMEVNQYNNNAVEKQQMMAGSAYVPLTTNEQA